MKLSTKGRYGLKAMVDLAVHSTDSHISLKSIAERQEISENYLEQLFAILRKEGLVKSIRGAQGGYALSGSPGSITVGAVLRALEGSLAPVDCVEADASDRCDRYDACVTRSVWAKINTCVNEVVDSITLQDLVDEYTKMQDSPNLTYYI